MTLSDQDRTFLESHDSAAMVTVGEDGVAKAVRMSVALVDGNLWSSGRQDRVRTRRLRKDPRCTLFIFDPGYTWLTLETTVTLLDGPDAPQLNLNFMRQIQAKPEGPLSWFGGDLSQEQFLQTMVDEGRLIYQFEVLRTYGMH